MAQTTRRIALTIEYDGTEFAGFQRQGQGERTVQGVLSAAISELTGADDVVVHPAGRTDSGVHALGQVAHFDTHSALGASRLLSALNALLPRDVSIAGLRETDARFHARFAATRRTYVYCVLMRPQRSALWERYSLLETKPLDIPAMRSAAELLTGTHDFRAFANNGGNPGSTTVRRIDRIALRRARGGEMLLIAVSANAFLRAMVRNIVGAMLEVGRGSREAESIGAILDSADRGKNPCRTAAAKGLCLLKVDYDGLGSPQKTENDLLLHPDGDGAGNEVSDEEG